MSTTTSRLGLIKAAAADAVSVLRTGNATNADVLDDAVTYEQGAVGSRPTSTSGTPGLAGRLFRRTDLTPDVVELDHGTGWAPMHATGMFRAHRSADVAVASGAVVPFNTDSGSSFDVRGWFNTGTYRYIPGEAGYYDLSAVVVTAPLAALDSWVVISLRKNGTEIARGEIGVDRGAGVTADVSDLVVANGSSDYFDVVIASNEASATITSGAAYSRFFGKFVAAA